eukprot:jgi/Tetstr1/427998/TSEL_018071.t1
MACRALPAATLATLLLAVLVCHDDAVALAALHRSDRLVGTIGTLDRRQGCPSVSAGEHEVLHGGPQRPSAQWLYTYPQGDAGGGRDHYTHMAMVTQLPNGTFLGLWQASAKREGSSDQHLTVTTSQDGQALQWTPPQPLSAVGDGVYPLWGPTLLVDSQQGVLWVFYSQNTGSCRGGPMEFPPGGDIKGVRYDLTTQEWGQPQLILSQDADGGIPKVTANKAIELSTGEFVMPFWRERALLGGNGACQQLRGSPGAGVLVSEDRGATWKAHGHLQLKNSWLIENALVELAGGRLMMVFRTQAKRVYVAYSADKGRTWSNAEPLSDFPNPNTKVDLTRLQPNGELVLVYNDHMKPTKDPSLHAQGCTRCRTHLRVAISRDEGATWQPLADLEEEVQPTLRFHYPTLQQYGCNLLVAYSAFHMEQRDGNTGTQGIKVRYVDLDPAGSAPAIAPRPQRAPLPWALVSVFAALSLLVVGRVACRMRL